MTDTNGPLKDASEAAGAQGIRLRDAAFGDQLCNIMKKVKLTLNKDSIKICCHVSTLFLDLSSSLS